nr:uncharacterized protein LOC113707843 [Coffea arabica]
MATDESQEYADWRARQKERERERRRMRDRQRRQSMSLEERERHLARRRRNYQLRRQRAANAQLGFQQTHVNLSNASSEVESDVQNDNLALVSLPEFTVQSNCGTFEDGFGGAYEKHASVIKFDGETTLHESHKYPRILRFNRIKQLARRLNSPVDKTGTDGDSRQIGAAVTNEEIVNPHCVTGRKIRLIHVKHLARALHSNVGKTLQQN